MKTRKKSHFGLSPGKFFVILLVVLASVYFIWQYIFIQNSIKSNAKDYKTDICCGSGQKYGCPPGYSCQDVPKFRGAGGGCQKTCQRKNYRRPR